MFRGYWENDKCLKILLRIYLKSLHIHLNPSQNVSLISLFYSLVIVTYEGSIVCKCFKYGNGGGIRSNLAYFVHIWNISNIACHKESLKFNLFFISKFRFDWVHGKMLNDTHLMVMKIKYVEGTEHRSSCSQVFCKNVYCNFIKKRLWHRCFPVNFPISKNTFMGASENSNRNAVF